MLKPRDRLQAYLAKAQAATPACKWGHGFRERVDYSTDLKGDAEVCSTGPIFRGDGEWFWGDAGRMAVRQAREDSEFTFASRTDGPWAAAKLLEALPIIEKLAHHQCTEICDEVHPAHPETEQELAAKALLAELERAP